MKHLAIMRQPWFNLVLTGKKTIESRASVNQIAPFLRIKENDTIFFKESGAFCVYVQATAGLVEFYAFNPIEDQLNHIQNQLKIHKAAICIDDAYIESKSAAGSYPHGGSSKLACFSLGSRKGTFESSCHPLMRPRAGRSRGMK